MAGYLLIESRDPFESNEAGYCYDLADQLKREGHQVTLFLVQNGVLPARRAARRTALADAVGAGVEVLADEFSLRERGIGQLGDGIRSAGLDVVVDRLVEGRKAIWH